MRRVSVFALIIALIIPLAVGGISAALTYKGMAEYGSMNKPPLSPPAWIFPVVWTIMYLLMGLASYLIFVSESNYHSKTFALLVYAVQLAMNFMWSILFFNLGYYLFAFIWLFIMWGIVIVCAILFRGFSRVAAVLMIPYILWLTFAAYLNLGTYLLNRK